MRSRYLVLILFAVGMTIVGGLGIRLQGAVSGVELAPSHFQQRNFSFYEIPVLQWQITPIRRRSPASPLVTHLMANNLISVPATAPQVWHPASISRGLAGIEIADAMLLLDQLNLRRGDDWFWKRWTEANPQRAKVLWPVVQDLAERELYILIPALFERALDELPPTEFRDAIDQLLSRQYRELIVDMRAAERNDLANALWREATADFPDDEPLRVLAPDELAPDELAPDETRRAP